MKQFIIADFEWAVTPYPSETHFQYFNEILSAGAVRIDEEGQILDQFYTLIQPMTPEYLHPVVLNVLLLDRAALAYAPSFSRFFEEFCAFTRNLPIFTWGCADRSALLQNLRVKGGCSAESASSLIPKMRDLQPILSRGAGLRQPYPGLAALLNHLGLMQDSKNRHNALADASDTARILSYLQKNNPDSVTELFSLKSEDTSPAVPTATGVLQTTTPPAPTPGESLHAARSLRYYCPICGNAGSTGTWIRMSKTEMLTLFYCEHHGKFLLETVSRPIKETNLYTASAILFPYDSHQKKRYTAARQTARLRRIKVSSAETEGQINASSSNSSEIDPAQDKTYKKTDDL
ncbi:MAG: hypothetical protein IJC98_05970 [Clostridia bacterium]|nr:hypothetical protein [Clostridia bacterium]